MNRYSRNMNMLSKEENEKLKDFRVCVIGCGGLGGYILEFLGRLGVGYLTAVDGDVFEISNLNRQIISDETNIGMKKAIMFKKRMSQVNSNIEINAIDEFLSLNNAEKILQGHHVIVDALDNLSMRKLLQKQCKEQSIPLVHGAIAGWYGQVCTVFPGDDTLDRIYPENVEKGIETDLGNPSFTPALVASIQVSEILKVLFKRGDVLQNKMLTVNLYDNEYETITL